jgi:hypothetical protein
MRPAAETESGRVVRRKERKRKREKRRDIWVMEFGLCLWEVYKVYHERKRLITKDHLRTLKPSGFIND